MPNRGGTGFIVWAPLSQSHWTGDSLALTSRVSIVPRKEAPDISVFEGELSRDDRNQLFWASHGLRFRWSDEEALSSQEVVNCFLLALWLVVPTKAHVKMRFEVPAQGDPADGSRFHRVLSRFSFLEGRTRNQVSSEDLEAVRPCLEAMLSIGEKQGRLWQALVLMYTACATVQWHVAFVCHSVGAETLLPYSRERGLTKRLATSCACLLRDRASERDVLFQEFSALYDTRSDIVHGRLHALKATPQEKVDRLARLEDIMRELWRCVLTRRDWIVELEKDDRSRRSFFSQTESGYTPPK